MKKTEKVQFENRLGQKLDAVIEFPVNQKPTNYAIFAHCFTCSKNFRAVREISTSLAAEGFAVLSFDFTGLGSSEGDFADTNFSTSVEDLLDAAEFMTSNYGAPNLIVGHSLGGSASIFAGSTIESINAVVTVGSPADPNHVRHLVASSENEIVSKGAAEVSIGGRPFMIKKQFLDDLVRHDLKETLAASEKAYLFMHSPQDLTVGIENAAEMYQAARHPKSFVSLDGADHLLTKHDDARYAGRVIANWASRYVSAVEKTELNTDGDVIGYLGPDVIYTTELGARQHRIVADEPAKLGGDDFGPTPYELLSSSLASCTLITLKMYASRKGWKIDEMYCHVSHSKEHKKDCDDCDNPKAKVDVFRRELEIVGSLSNDELKRLLEIADKCPVHKTLEASSAIETELLNRVL